MVPLSRNLGLGIAILSYCGSLHFGLLADRDTFPDLDVLAAGIADAFTEMREHAEAHDVGGRRPRPTRRSPPTPRRERSAAGVLDPRGLGARRRRAGGRDPAAGPARRVPRPIRTIDPQLNSVMLRRRVGALRRMPRPCDDAVGARRRSRPLAGLPVGVKELFQVAGWPDTHASLVYADRISDHDDVEAQRLRRAGARCSPA